MWPILSPGGYYQLPQDPSLYMWYAADQIFGANSTYPSNGSAVNFMFDLSGNNNHIIQNTGSRQPLFATNIQNGLPGIDFTGNLTAGFTGSSSPNTSTFTFFAVTSIFDTNTRKYVMNISPTSTDTCNVNYRYESTGALVYIAPATSSTLKTLNSGSYTAIPNIFYGFSMNGSQQDYFNGVLKASNTTASNYQMINPNTYYVGNTSNFSASLNGYLFESMYYNRVLSTTEINNVLTYLKWKWGISF